MEILCALLFVTVTTRGKVGWKLRVSILTDAARALEFLHRKGLIHRDIKSPNILLDSQHRCKIADFGMARQIGTDMTVVGTGELNVWDCRENGFPSCCLSGICDRSGYGNL